MNDFRVGVIGAGSIGCYLGGVLAAGGIPTVLLGRQRIETEIGEYGLTLAALDGAQRHLEHGAIPFVTDAAALPAIDVALIAVKSGDSAATARALAAVLPPTACIVSMQNGLHNAEVLQAGLPQHEVLAGIVGFNVVAMGRGVFRRTTTGEIIIQSTDDDRIARIANCLRASRLAVDLRSDVRALQWSKLVMNLNNAVSALSDVPTTRILFDPGYRRVLRAIVTEAIGVMGRAHISTARLGAAPVSLFPFILGLPTPLLRLVLKTQLRVDPEARSSMWADLIRGRRTEVDELNGEIVRLAESVGRDAPINRRVVEVVRAAETRAQGSPGMSAEQLARALGIT